MKILQLLASMSVIALAITLTEATAEEAPAADASFALPQSKINIANCKNAITKDHPGFITRQQELHRSGKAYFLYEVMGTDGFEWSLICDIATGKLTHEQKLDSE